MAKYRSHINVILILFTLFIFLFNGWYTDRNKVNTDGDAADFISIAVSLVEHQKFGNVKVEGGIIKAFEEENFPKEGYPFSQHTTWRPPVWPMIMAGIFFLFGYNLTYILIFKFLLHLFGTFIFYKTLKLLKFSELILIAGTFVYAISPSSQLYSRVFLSEPVTLFFITAWVYYLIKFLQAKVNFVPQAVLGGVIILTHPYSVFLPFSIWLFLFIKKQLNFKILTLSAVLCISVISVWIVRNLIVLETQHIILTTSSGAALAIGWNENVPKQHTNTKGDLADKNLVLKNYVYDKEILSNEVLSMNLYKNATLQFIQKNPNLILPIIIKKLTSAFNPFPETPKPSILEYGRALTHLLALLSLLYIIFISKNKIYHSLAMGLILSTILITILTYSGFRFRMPQVGLELLLIMYVVQYIVQKRNINGRSI